MPKDALVKRINQSHQARFVSGGTAESLIAQIAPDEELDHWLRIPPEFGISQLIYGDVETPDTGLLIHNVNGAGRIAYWDSGSEQIRLGSLEGNWDYNDEAYGIALGKYAPNNANLVYDSTNGLRLRIYNQSYIQLTNDGSALISGRLQLKGLESALAIGEIPPVSASAGTGIWIDRTGFYSLSSDVLQFKIDAATGSLIAGGGDVRIDGQGLVLNCDMAPALTDTYDLGSIDKWWRSLYASTINSTVFAQNVQQVIGGSFLIPKNTGTLPLVGAQSDSIDFGKTMTVGDHILIKSFDEGGVPKTEYIKIGDLISGTYYGVTRDEAGAHATDPVWPDGTPYAVLGQAGNGWIQLDATTTPRMSVFTLGSAYNIQNEVYRAGNLKGNWGYGSDIYGLAVGEYASNKANMVYDPNSGLRLRIYDADYIQLDTSGNALITNKLQLKGTTSALAIGATPPTSASAGTGVWLDRTGMYALTSNSAKAVVNAGGVRVARNTDGMRFVSDADVMVDTDSADGRMFHQSSDNALVIKAPSAYFNLDVGKGAFRANVGGTDPFWKLFSKGTTSPGDANSNVRLAFGTNSNNFAMLEQASGKPLLNVYLGTGTNPQRQFGVYYQDTAPTYVPLVRIVSLKVAGNGGTGYIGTQAYGSGTYIQYAFVILHGWKDDDGGTPVWCMGGLYKPASGYNAIYFTNDNSLVKAAGGDHFVYLNSDGHFAIRNNSNAAFQYMGIAFTAQT